MTSAIPPSAQPNVHHSAINTATAAASSSGTTSPLPGAVPAQLSVRSYANATKTASAAPPAAAGASAQDAKSSESPVNGVSAMAHGGSQPNGLPPQPHQQPADHSRKPSVVINASGASGTIPNGGPVGQNGRVHINFGAMGEQPGMPYHAQPSSLPAPHRDPRVISPAHSPSPIPHAQSSGGRPPISLQNQGNGMTFGQLGSDGDQYRQGQIPLGPNIPSLHERRTSSQSMQSDMSSSNMSGMNRPAFMPPNGRGRGGYPPQGYNAGMPSPGPGYRAMPGQQAPRPNMQAPFPGQPSPFPHRTGSPAVPHARPNMAPYGYQPNMNPQNAHMFGNYEPYGGYYQPYGYGQYPGQPPQSPRPPYPNPYNAPPPAMAPPFNPPEMSRSASQSSQRPPSSMGQPSTPAMTNQLPHGQTPVSQPPQAPSSGNFVRPRKTNAIKITDAQGNEVNFTKAPPTPSQAAPQTPVIVSTPNAPTPPPRAPSGQHMRAESKAAKSSEETKNAFQEQVKRQVEEQKRKQLEEEEAAKAKAEREENEAKEKAAERERAEAAAQDQVKEATVEAEKAAAVAANDEEAVQDAEAAEAALKKDDGEKTEKEETEEERLEREIAEMEAADREEEERQRAYEEKKRKEREEAAVRQAELDKKRDEELKRQEREAEELADAREREREAERQKQSVEPDDEAKAMFASLKKSTLGPSASAPESGAETPISEKDEDEVQTREQTPEAVADKASMPPPSQPAGRTGTVPKPRPANLKLETTKRVEPAEPTPGMQSLKSARFLEIKEEARYPEGVKSPNPALNLGGARKSRAYDRDFLMQFQNVFKEKPSVDWDMKIKETLGSSDESASARPNSARTPSGMQRQPSGRPVPPSVPSFGGPMGSFGGNARGTSSEQRFAAASMGGRPAGPGMGMGPIRVPSNLGIGAPGMPMGRPGAVQGMGAMGPPQSPRQPSGRSGRGASKRDTNRPSAKQEAEMAAKMPLTAHMEIAPLQKSNSGWVATSIGRPSMAGPDPSGHLAPDVVQKKVKGALNKMTPENFDKITDQILEIAHQSKNETDGRTLRQVIQLTFEKACDEAHWAGMYARFCAKMLTTMSSEIQDETIKDKNGQPVVGGALFRKYLLNRCQEEFERGWQANLPTKPEGDSKEAVLLSDEYYIAAAAKRRGLGLIQFIGQLYKLRMLTIKIMHECVLRLLNFEGDPDEATVENLTTLLRSVGSTMDQDEQGQSLINAYFQRIDDLFLKSDKLASRPKFMIMDLIDLRKAGWKGKGEAKGPKTIEEIRAEAAAAQVKAEAERQKMNQRPGGGGRMQTGRGDARQFSGSAQPPVDLNRTTVGVDDLRKLQQRNASNRQAGGGLGPSLGPGGGLSALSGRGGSRRGNLGPPASGNSTRTNTPPVEKKDEPSPQSNAFSALATLDPSGEDATSQAGDAASPPAGTRNRSKSPLPAEQGEEAS